MTADRHAAATDERRETFYHYSAPFGVPYRQRDRTKAVEKLLVYFTENNRPILEAVSRVIDYNEKVVVRCGVLLNFNSILLVLILFAANKLDWSSIDVWKKVIFYIITIAWTLSNACLIFSIRHKFAMPHEFASQTDFRFTADLYIKRMLIYNITLMLSLVAFLAVTFIFMFPFDISYYEKMLPH
jgi:hypothetical protein